MKKKIYQFKREKAFIGGSHQKFYCEVEANNKAEAIRTVKNTPVEKLRWRWIDSYDRSKENYDEVSFECILD